MFCFVFLHALASEKCGLLCWHHCPRGLPVKFISMRGDRARLDLKQIFKKKQNKKRILGLKDEEGWSIRSNPRDRKQTARQRGHSKHSPTLPLVCLLQKCIEYVYIYIYFKACALLNILLGWLHFLDTRG